jgi:hypothetical protein
MLIFFMQKGLGIVCQTDDIGGDQEGSSNTDMGIVWLVDYKNIHFFSCFTN